MPIKIGVLALQGCITLHKPHIQATGANYIEVTHKSQLETIDAIILPGGESSSMLKALHSFDMFSALKNFSKNKPTWGICAGIILLAETVINPTQSSLQSISIEVTRNYYGRQLDSFETTIYGSKVSYIRAPKISKIISHLVHIKYTDYNNPVWIEYKNLMGTTFHSELSMNYPSPFHTFFYHKIIKNRDNNQ